MDSNYKHKIHQNQQYREQQTRKQSNNIEDRIAK